MNEEKEITLGQIFAVFKKSFLRGVIYALVCVILATGVLLAVKGFTGKSVYSSTVSFKEADETTLSSMNAYKSTVVGKALDSVYKDDAEKALEISDKITKALTVSASIPDTLGENEEFVPTSFVVQLKTDSELDLTNGEYKAILDAVNVEYINVFASKTFPSISYGVNIDNQLTVLDYIQVVDGLLDNVNSYITSINSFVANNSSALQFKADGQSETLEMVLNELAVIKNQLSALQLSVVSNKIEKSTDSIANYLELSKNTASSEKATYQAMADAAKANLDSYSTTIQNIVSDPNGANVYNFGGDEFYLKLSEEVITYTEKAQKAGAKETTFTYLQGKSGTASDSISGDAVAAALKGASTALQTAVNKYTNLSNEYNQNKGLTSLARVVNPAQSTVESFINIKLILVVDVVVILVSLIVAFAQTFSKMKKQGFFNQEEVKA